MNIAILQGRPTREPELTDTKTGKVMCKMRLAVDRPYLGKNAPKKTDYFDVISFGDLGRTIYMHLPKGGLCTVLGRLEQSEYETHLGDRREKYTVVANKITIHDWKDTVTNKLELEANEDLLVPREITASLRKKCIELSDEDIPTELL